FEVAAKHLSFTLAATELNVSQAAISQQIRNLEKALNVPLFLRKHNDLERTSAGVTLLRSVSRGLDSSGVITCSGTNAVALYWFKPHIDRFRARHPEIRFALLSSDEDDSFRNHSNVDLSLESAVLGEHAIHAPDDSRFAVGSGTKAARSA
ncbi:MAG: LysR family transcriptional regulator, partial [Planctomycetaceae bacterium]